MRIKVVLFILLGFMLLPEIANADIRVDRLNTNPEISIKAEDDSIQLSFNQKNEHVDYYYVNVCERNEMNKMEKGCYKDYFSYILPKKDTINMPVKNEGYYNYSVLSVNKDKTYTYYGEVNFEFFNPTYLSSSFIVDVEHPLIKEILTKEFKGYEKWSTSEKSKKIHRYIVNNYSYDYDILMTDEFKNGYLHPNYDRISVKNKGICYDLASLYVSLLRGMGVPAALSIGDATEGDFIGYHAWVTLSIDGEEKIIDPTWDLLTKNYTYRTKSNYVEHFKY